MEGFRVRGLQGFCFGVVGFDKWGCAVLHAEHILKPQLSEFKGSRLPVFEFPFFFFWVVVLKVSGLEGWRVSGFEGCRVLVLGCRF